MLPLKEAMIMDIFGEMSLPENDDALLLFDEGDDELFLDESEHESILDDDMLLGEDELIDSQNAWKIIIADDETRVHEVTKHVLHDFSFEGKGLKFLSAYSGEEAKGLVEKHSDTALILLDVVMEKNTSGLEVARYIRRQLKNNFIRIVLRTGQPGEAPEKSVILEYNINDYKNKSELTHQKLFTTLVASLRSYRDLMTIEMHLKELEERNIQIVLMNEQLQKEIAKRKEKDTFFSIIAHDLTNPFQPLLGLSQLLTNKALTAEREDIHKMGIHIYRAARNVYGLLKNLLQWSRMERGLVDVQPFMLILHDIVNRNVELLNPNAAHKQINLQSTVSDNITVFADENMLDTVIRNLISNAIKFTKTGGNITISAIPYDKFVEISVTDTGLGISQENIANLFRIDINLSTKGTNGEVGTGLGLVMCKEMVERNGGQISVESEKGKGTRVKFTVPCNVCSQLVKVIK